MSQVKYTLKRWCNTCDFKISVFTICQNTSFINFFILSYMSEIQKLINKLFQWSTGNSITQSFLESKNWKHLTLKGIYYHFLTLRIYQKKTTKIYQMTFLLLFYLEAPWLAQYTYKMLFRKMNFNIYLLTCSLFLEKLCLNMYLKCAFIISTLRL